MSALYDHFAMLHRIASENGGKFPDHVSVSPQEALDIAEDTAECLRWSENGAQEIFEFMEMGDFSIAGVRIIIE